MSETERTTPAPNGATSRQQYLLDNYSVDVEPVHLAVTTRHKDTGEAAGCLHVVENGDLGIADVADRIVRSTEEGCLLVALAVDADHDEVHYGTLPGVAAKEIILRGIEALEVALAAVSQVAP